MRVVIHTSNLIEQDWYQKTQGLELRKLIKNIQKMLILFYNQRIWMSGMFPRIEDSDLKKAGANLKLYDSKTSFKQYLMMYLEYYHEKKLNYWIDLIKHHDMSSAK